MHPLLAQTVLMPDDNNQTSADQVSHELPKPLYAEPQSLYNDNPDQAANDEERPAPEAPLPIPSEVAEDSSVTVAAPKSPSNSGAPAHGGDVDDHSYDAVTSGFKKQQNKVLSPFHLFLLPFSWPLVCILCRTCRGGFCNFIALLVRLPLPGFLGFHECFECLLGLPLFRLDPTYSCFPL